MYPMLKRYEASLGLPEARAADLPSEADRRAAVWTLQMSSVGGESSKSPTVTMHTGTRSDLL